jgi:UV excision repair protein RAD23
MSTCRDEPKPAVAAPATPSSPSTPAATPATPSTPAATTQAGATGAAESAAASTLVQGDQFEAMVASIMEMGFPREMVIRALNASFRNPDRAVQFLLSVRKSPVDAVVESVSHVRLTGPNPRRC